MDLFSAIPAEQIDSPQLLLLALSCPAGQLVWASERPRFVDVRADCNHFPRCGRGPGRAGTEEHDRDRPVSRSWCDVHDLSCDARIVVAAGLRALEGEALRRSSRRRVARRGDRRTPAFA